MKKRGVTILAIGDRKDYDSHRKFNKERHFFIDNGFDYASCNYKDVESGRFPKVQTKKVMIFLFFPFYHWDKYIEHRHYKGVYGNLKFFKKFRKFNGKLRYILTKAYRGKEIFFVNVKMLLYMN